MVDNKLAYSKAFESSERALIFQSASWLEIVTQGNWTPLISTKGELISAIMPIVLKNKYGLKQITLPPLTPYLGPVFNYPSDLAAKNRFSFEQKALQDLISKIPQVDRFITQCDFNFTNWLPFAWNNFNQTTRYSYLLNTQKDESALLHNFKSNIQKEINKAQLKFTIKEAESTENIFNIYLNECTRKQERVLFTHEMLNQLFKRFSPTKELTILEALNEEGKCVAAFCLARDAHFVHYLLGAVNIQYRNQGAMSLLMWNAILFAKSHDVNFNFEGSMHQSIGRYFSSFGGELTPYFQITKANHKIFKHLSRFHY